MLIIPAIDILDGKCVRLTKGDYDSVRVYDHDPVSMARRFEDMGAKRIHLVDLDAARGGEKKNRITLKNIRKAVSCLIQVGGGIRTADDAKELIDAGIDRLVLGTILAKTPDTVASWINRFGSLFIAGIDALNGSVKISGWSVDSRIADTELAVKAKALGMCGIIYTNIAKDGTLGGPDIDRTNLIAHTSGLPVMLSGGISSIEDVKAVAEKKSAGVVGILTGKAIYEGALDIKRALQQYQKVDTGDTAW